MSGNDEQAVVDEVFQERTASHKKEVTTESYKQTVLDPEWRESMMGKCISECGSGRMGTGAELCLLGHLGHSLLGASNQGE